MQVFLSYPSWFFLLCIGLALIYTFLFYFKQKQTLLIPKAILYLLQIARFFSISIISFLLLAPFVKRHSSKTEKPIIVIAEDHSASSKFAFRKTDSAKYKADLERLSLELAEKFEVRSYSFDEGLNSTFLSTFDGKTTNLSQTLQDINDVYFNRNVGAIVLISDGIYNRGISPLYTEASNRYPIYTVLLGDTSKRKDAKIQNVFCNEIVYLNDKFEIKTDLSAYNCESNNAKVLIELIGQQGKKNVVASSEINYTKNQEEKTLSIPITASAVGLFHYRVTHTSIAGEFTLENNTKDIYVQVLDGRDKILLLADGPHPDLSALKQAIEGNKNYSVEIKYANEPINNLQDYTIVILHQLPSISNSITNIRKEINEKNISTWFVLGANANVSELSNMQGVIGITKARNLFNESYAHANRDFSSFSLNENYLKLYEKLPPLSVPYGEYKNNANNTLLYQKIGSVNTTYPLLAMGDVLQQKQAVLLGEGIWRWRIYDYMLNRNYEAVDDLILKTVQYLSVKGDKRKFKTMLPKNVINENENAIVNAQMYNDNYELINNCDVTITLYNESNKKYTYTFSKKNNYYELDLGKLENGIYTYLAESKCNGNIYKDQGQFTVKALQLEALQTVADKELLYTLAHKNGAEMVYANQLLSLINLIQSKKDIKPVIYDSYKTDSIIHFKFLFAIIIFLLAVEWIIRKYLGLY